MATWFIVSISALGFLVMVGGLVYAMGGREGNEKALSAEIKSVERDATAARVKADALEKEHAAVKQDLRGLWEWVRYFRRRIDRIDERLGLK